MTVSATSSNDFDPKPGAIIDDTDSDREEIEIDSHSASQELDSSFGASVASRSQGQPLLAQSLPVLTLIQVLIL